jgi:predicted O-methyltransferase YrrM
VSALIRDLPWMSPEEGSTVVSFVREHGIRDVLELGFHHGVSTCYFAAGVGPQGRVTTIDREEARSLEPNIHELLRRCGFAERVTIHYEPSTYTWRLMKLLEEDPTPRFDLCFIDGAHTWAEDGFAFLLADRLLRDGGWIILDDLDWTFSRAPDAYTRSVARVLVTEERNTAQIRKVYELLVKSHPSYGEFKTEGHWAYARKLGSQRAGEIRTERIVRTLPVPVETLHELMARERAARDPGTR